MWLPSLCTGGLQNWREARSVIIPQSPKFSSLCLIPNSQFVRPSPPPLCLRPRSPTFTTVLPSPPLTVLQLQHPESSRPLCCGARATDLCPPASKLQLQCATHLTIQLHLQFETHPQPQERIFQRHVF